MDNDLMLNSSLIKSLRRKSGWTQEQLAQVSGLSLRTIQRVESEGKASLETRACLAATFEVSLSELVDEPAPSHHRSNYSKRALIIFLCSLILSVLGHWFFDFGSIAIVANFLVVSCSIYCAFRWYFSDASPARGTLKSTIKVGFIYSAVFVLFGLLGNHGDDMLFPLLVSLLLFSSLFYLNAVRLSKAANAAQ